MKNLYTLKKIDHRIISMLLVMVVMALPEYAASQTLKPFTQRTSVYSPTTKIYKIKGDFTMVGNTNMTLVNYGDETNNSSLMRYVDVDGVASTLNSSSSTLGFSTENGANPVCSNIIYAGLYWTGRADDGGASPLTVTIPGGTSDYQSGSLIRGYNLTITQTGNNNDLTALYTFTPVGGGDPVVFTFYSTDNGGWSGTLTVKVGAGAAVAVPFTFTTGTVGDNWALATLTTPYTISSGPASFQINTLRKARENNTIDDTFYSSITTAGSTLNKLQVKLRHGSDAYQTVTANANDIFYPSDANGNMYSAYAEVTDYVKAKGLGEYTVADIALREGDGGGTGYFGGWGMIVVYENPLMKDRDVTIFDGHAYVYDELNSDAMTYYELPISGFNTAREGHITMKYGLIAGEGDRYLNAPTIDNFSVRNHSDNAWVNLNHPNNSTSNFFNSSVYTGGNPRNPEILNNTGMDLVMDTVPNVNNAVITTNQTSTKFQYGTNQDTYIIFCIAMSVNAYRPEVEGLNSAIALNSVPVVPPGTKVIPGDVITYEVEVRNLGNEAIENGRMVIPLPFTAIHGLVVDYQNFHLQGAGNPYFDINEGANGSIVWDMGTLPLVEAPDDLLAVLEFSFEVTKDCATLALVVNEDCKLAVDVDGTISGVGAISGNELAGASFITGYDTGDCEDVPIYEPVSLEIDALAYVEAHCAETNLYRDFPFCNYQGQTIPITEFTGEFPAGSRFYDAYPVVATSTTEYTISNPFPATPGTSTYYALFPGTTTCYYQFTISVVSVTEPPVPQNVEYCAGETAVALTATTTNPSYSLFFYDAPGGTATSTIIPSTAVAGTTTYWVAQGVTGCVGPTATLTVTINPLPELTCPTDIVVSNDPGDCSAEVSFEASVGGAATLTYTVGGSPITSPWIFPVGVTTVTVTAENECGPVTCDFTVIVSDNEKPVITTTAQSGHLGCNPVVTPPVFTGSDNCNGTITPIVNTVGKQNYGEFCDQIQTWTATFTDASGNVATEVSVTYIWTEDSKAPVINTTAVSGDLGCNPKVVAPVFTLQSDPSGCFLTSEINVATAGPVANGCSWSQSWTATITDNCGNVATPVTITYTWSQDTELPVISTTATSGDLGCNPTVVAPLFTGLDNCAGVFTPVVNTTGPSRNGCAYTQTWVATYTDACQNSALPVTITYTWSQDTELPVISTTASSGDLGCNPTVVAPLFTGLDNCAGVFTPVVNTTGPSRNGCAYTQTWVATYTDACQNSALPVTITYTWSQDTELPVISTTASSGDLGCNPTVVAPLFTGLDNCAGVFTPAVNTTGPSQNGCAYTQTWVATYTDACQNSALPVTITYTWTQDTELPVITLAGDALVTLCVGDDYTEAGATGMDNCGGAMTPTVSGSVDPAVAGTYTITFTLTDACGNPAIPVVRIVNVSAYPELDIKGATANGDAMPGDLETGYILDLDCNDTEEDFLIQFASGSSSSEALAAQYFGLYLTGSTVSPTDLAAYYTARGVPEPYLSYLIAAANGTKPFAYINGSTVLLVDGAKHEFNPSTDVAMTIPGDYPFGTYTVSGTIVDASGCETPVTFILKVQGDRTLPEVDITGPDPVCPASENIYRASEGMETYLWSVTGATISGTSTAQSVTVVAGTTCSSTFELTLSVTSPSGCYGTASKTVTVDVVEDFTMPADTETTVACIDDIEVPEPPVVSDACGNELVPVALPQPEPGNCGDEMVYSWTYMDCAGHLHTWTHTINLVDEEDPVITCPNDISVTVATGVTSATVTIIPATATDNCSAEVDGVRSDALGLDAPYPIGVTTILWTATDWCGNAVTCTSKVTVNDRPYVAGTVFHDKDRLTDGMVDGTGTDGGGLLYVNLIDEDDLVVTSQKVNSDGTYRFDDVMDGAYVLQLTIHQGIPGGSMPLTVLPANWIHTGENLGAGTGSDGTPNGLLAIAVDLVTNAEEANFGIVKVQDVTINLTAAPNVMAGNTNFRLWIKITELNGVDTQGDITVIIPKDSRWILNGAFNTSLTLLGSTPVNNSDWTFSDTDPDYYIFTTPAVIPAGLFSTFGFDAVFSPGNASGISTITAQIRSGSGGENRVNNNADSEKIDYFAK
jgi:hypothetical protein